MNPKQEKIEILDTQILASLLMIVSVFISMMVFYNEECLIQGKKPIFSKESALQVTFYNRVFIIVIILLFLTANMRNLGLDQKTNQDTELDYWDILGSILTMSSGLIALYVAYRSVIENKLTIADIESDI